MVKRGFLKVAGLALLLVGCGGGGDGTTSGAGGSGSSADLERRIVVISDSIGRGYGASFGFPDLLESLTGIPVVNISKNGTNAQTGVARIPDIMVDYKPMYLVILLGTNNAGQDDVSGAVNSLRYGASVGIEAGATVIIGTLPPISRSSTENRNASAISAGIRDIPGIRVAPIDGSLGFGDLGPDGKHPDDGGQRKIAQQFADQI